MFDFAWSEIALIGIVALVLIGPKDLPIAIRAITDVIKKMRRMAGELQTHVDDLVRDADLQEARDTFRDLRGMNLRSQVMRAVDSDGALHRTLTEKPLAGQNLLTGRPSLIPPPIPPEGAAPSFLPPGTARPAAAEAGPPPAAAPPAFVPPAFVPPAAVKQAAVPPADAIGQPAASTDAAT